MVTATQSIIPVKHSESQNDSLILYVLIKATNTWKQKGEVKNLRPHLWILVGLVGI